jgi:hypothetical protein
MILFSEFSFSVPGSRIEEKGGEWGVGCLVRGPLLSNVITLGLFWRGQCWIQWSNLLGRGCRLFSLALFLDSPRWAPFVEDQLGPPVQVKDLYKRNCIVDFNILVIGLYRPDRWPGAFVALLIGMKKRLGGCPGTNLAMGIAETLT